MIQEPTLRKWGGRHEEGPLLCRRRPVHRRRASEGKDADEAAEKLFETKCSACHPHKRAGDKKKSGEEWERAVPRMIKTNGAKITDAEAKTIVDYLAREHGK